MNQYQIVSENPESTVVAEYTSDYKREVTYQSEAELEKAFIQLLEKQAYQFLNFTSEKDLVNNLRLQLEKLNNFQFTDNEWNDFFVQKIANPNSGIEEKTTIIQEDYIQLLECEDGTIRNIRLLDKHNIHNNNLQVINQYETDEGKRANRYDVTVLVNGLPLVHIELKKRGVSLQEAFNQINRYNRESFWAGSGLFEYVQLFVISNGTLTKYYSNTTRFSHLKEKEKEGSKKKKTSHSYEFTSWWSDANNKAILDLMDFGKTFFAKHTLLNILTKYSVFTSDKSLLVMRPYQIVATERVLTKINASYNYKKYGSISFGDDPSGQYLVSTKPFWALADQYKNDTIGDEIAWRASQQRLGGECEGMIGCASIASQRTDGEYLKRYPKGRYVKPALANVTDNFKYMLQEWNKPEQDASDANLKEWAVILSPQANNPNAKKALGYLKQMQGMTKK